MRRHHPTKPRSTERLHRLIRDIAILLGCQLLGEATTRGLELQAPGPLIGGVFLLLALIVLRRTNGRFPLADKAAEGLGDTSSKLLAMLGLMFVPAGVGIMQHLTLFADMGLEVAVVLIGSALATLLATVFTFLAVSRLVPPR